MTNDELTTYKHVARLFRLNGGSADFEVFYAHTRANQMLLVQGRKDPCFNGRY